MRFCPLPPVVLDFDDSVGKLSDSELRYPLQTWQESLRFGCFKEDLKRLEKQLPLPVDIGCVFLGSGDFHHISLIPLRKLAAQNKEIELVVFDNHPDNMRYPFGIHCGSWVYHASRMPEVKKIHVIGITSGDIDWPHSWENHLSPFLTGKLTYWSVGRKAAWLKMIGKGEHCRCFDNADELVENFVKVSLNHDIMNGCYNIYLSIDKDVFSPDVVKTNWDQGVFGKKHLDKIVKACSGRIIGADVTGEVSFYKYKSLFKNFLSSIDGQYPIDNVRIKCWQQEQHEFNLQILKLLSDACDC